MFGRRIAQCKAEAVEELSIESEMQPNEEVFLGYAIKMTIAYMGK